MADELAKKISELDPLPNNDLRGFNAIGSKDNAQGNPVSYRVDLGFVTEAAQDAEAAAQDAEEAAEAFDAAIVQSTGDNQNKVMSQKATTDALATKQGVISDLSTIRSGASAGATAYQKPGGGIPSSDIANGVIPDVSNFITKSVNDLANYYQKSETYTKTEVNGLIGAIDQFHYEIYASISAITSPASNVLYLIGPTGSGSDKYEEYVYSGGNFVKIGDTTIDLSGYVTTTALNTALANYTTTTDLTTLLAGKVDKVNGKGLSTNDFTTEEKTKLSSIASGAQVNVIETVKVNGTALTPSSKSVNIDISGKADKDADAVEGNLAKFDANGNPVDGGIPVGYINQLGQKVDGAIVHSKNLADYAEVADGYVNSSGVFSTGDGEKSIIFPCEPSTTYTISKIETSRFRVAYFSSKPTDRAAGAGTITDHTATAITITTADNSSYIAAFVYNGSSESVSMSQIVASLQIEKGSQATKYETPGWIAVDKNARADISELDAIVSQHETKIEELTQSGGIPLNAIDYGFKKPTVIAGADVTGTANWETNGATILLESKYNNITRMNRSVMTITSEANGGMAWCNLATPVNANLYALLVEFRINYDGNNVPGSVVLELWSGTSRTSSYKKSIIFQLYGDDGYKRNGWHQACFFFPSAASFSADGASFDQTQVTAVGFHLYNSTNIAYSVSVARMDFVPAMKKPGIVTIVDNFGVSVPAMADYAYSKGVRLNLSIVPGAYTGASAASAYASKAELDRVASQGHCIWNHTYTHQVFNNLTFVQIQDQINLAEQWMEENGYGKNCDFLSIPSASFNTESADAVFESNVKTIFHNWCYNLQMVYVPYGPVMRTLPVTILDSTAIGAGKTPADIASVAAKCITYNGLAVIGFHGTYWELDNGDSWKAYIDAIAQLGVYHYGIDELVAGRWC